MKQKTIWTLWLQGRSHAPGLVERCIASWERENPSWEVRCLDARTVGRFVKVDDVVDLRRSAVTAASLSDIIRLLLLHEYGGVWADATLYCNSPLDQWLDPFLGGGFFAFGNPGPDRKLATWFIASEESTDLCAMWTDSMVRYWRGRTQTDDYFWLHHLFGDRYDTDPIMRSLWDSVPSVSADGPHTFSGPRMYEELATMQPPVDWSVPVFKLTNRFDPDAAKPGCILDHLDLRSPASSPPADAENVPGTPPTCAGLKVSTENLGDHIQILAAGDLLDRYGFKPGVLVDRDNEIASPPTTLNAGPHPILLNGWHKTNPSEWPPHETLDPIFLGFHIRPHQAPSLVSEEALDHYRAHQPIGCRDQFTLGLLRDRGVDAFLSNCLSLIVPRRLDDSRQQTDVIVASRDERIMDLLPPSLGPTIFVNHYSGSSDFDANLQRAGVLLERYRTRARLVVTTLLHSALPALAMGIPVVVFYPLNDDHGRRSDRERFSTLATMVRIYEFNEVDKVDWEGERIALGSTKLRILDAFASLSARWGSPTAPLIGPWSPPEVLLPAERTPSPGSLAAPDEATTGRQKMTVG